MALHVLMLSRDSTVEDPKSPTSRRLRRYEDAGCRIHAKYVSPRTFLKVLWDGLNIETNDDWVITSQDPFETGLLAIVLGWANDMPVEIQVHGDFFNPLWINEHWSRYWRIILARWVLLRSRMIRPVSERVARSIDWVVFHRVFPPDMKFQRSYKNDLGYTSRLEPKRTWKMLVLPTPTTRRIKKLPLSDKVILYAGRLAPEKNLPMLCDAFEMVRKEHPTAELHLQLSNAKEEGHWLPEPGNIHHCDDTCEFAASLCVIPSNHESWSRFAIEAALSGVPVVMTDVGCAGEIIVDGESGLVVNIGDPEKLAEAMTTMLQNPSFAEEMAVCAQEFAEKLPTEKETGEIMVDNWRSLYAQKT